MLQNSYELRFDEYGHSLIWSPYNAAFIADLKATFTGEMAMGKYWKDLDPGCQWDSILGCWKVYTGWKGCEDWITKLQTILDIHYPGKF